MVGRTRTEAVPGPLGGSAKRWINGVLRVNNVNDDPWISSYAQCTDVIGNRDGGNPLEITKFTTGTPLNGSITTSPGNTRTYAGYYPSAMANAPAHLALPSLPAESADMATAMARTNPGRTEASIPTMLAEMRDFPNMIRQRGLRLIGEQRRSSRRGYNPGRDRGSDAGEHLAQQFGWKPLLNDLKTLMEFEIVTERRFGELRRLYSRRGLKRRIQLGSVVLSSSDDAVAISSVLGDTVYAKRTTVTKRKRWATIRWKPSVPPPAETDETIRRRAHRLVFGINGISPQNSVDAWNAIPWSWLVDWFTNTGDFIQSYSNAIPVYADSKCVMTQTETVVQYIPLPGNPTWVSWGGATLTRSSKRRYVGGPLPAITMPILSARQWSILGSLAITRLR